MVCKLKIHMNWTRYKFNFCFWCKLLCCACLIVIQQILFLSPFLRGQLSIHTVDALILLSFRSMNILSLICPPFPVALIPWKRPPRTWWENMLRYANVFNHRSSKHNNVYRKQYMVVVARLITEYHRTPTSNIHGILSISYQSMIIPKKLYRRTLRVR